MLNISPLFDRELIAQCQTNAPRYTSYPTADRFTLEYTVNTHNLHLHNLANNLTKTQKAIALYIHIPFCNTLCLYCACNKIITNKREKISRYLTYLNKEIELCTQHLGTKPEVVQLHFGGGSPSWLTPAEIEQIMLILHRHFNLDNAQEIAMEIDPRHTDQQFIAHLAKLGFNRLSIGLQDLNPQVQKAVNRIQSFAANALVLEAARSYGFKSTNVDLIYGLPYQTLISFSETIEQIITLGPDRIALFNYAHLPHIFMSQTRIKESTLPDAQTKLDILQMSVERLLAANYIFIGMDHFALPNDELAIALKQGTLQRNFQGYSTCANTDLLGFGVSAIGSLDHCYYQNVKDLDSYYAHLDNDQLPVLRGRELSADDLLRKHVIMQLMCQYEIDYAQINQQFNIDFQHYFADELAALTNLTILKLVTINDAGIVVSAKGRFLIRNIAMTFDKYLNNDRHDGNKPRHYSKSI